MRRQNFTRAGGGGVHGLLSKVLMGRSNMRFPSVNGGFRRLLDLLSVDTEAVSLQSFVFDTIAAESDVIVP